MNRCQNFHRALCECSLRTEVINATEGDARIQPLIIIVVDIDNDSILTKPQQYRLSSSSAVIAGVYYVILSMGFLPCIIIIIIMNALHSRVRKTINGKME